MSARRAQEERAELLRGIDLADLLVELGRERALERRGSRFPCPSVRHDQTGRTPPASVRVTGGAYGVWRCHGCGEGGTAVDALIAADRARDVASAFAELRGERPVWAPSDWSQRPRGHGSGAGRPDSGHGFRRRRSPNRAARW